MSAALAVNPLPRLLPPAYRDSVFMAFVTRIRRS